MELNFKTDMQVTVGVKMIDIANNENVQDVVVLNNTSTWKKIYINFTNITQAQILGTSFIFYIDGVLPAGQLR